MEFRDKTWCDFYKSCKHGKHCKAALTDEVMAEAIRWWGSQDAPISTYADKPDCYDKKEDES